MGLLPRYSRTQRGLGCTREVLRSVCVCVCVHTRTSGHVCSVCGSPVSVSDCKICSTIS